MRDSLLYVHGMGGSAAECEHYRPLFPDLAVTGYDGPFDTPREAGQGIREAAETLTAGGGRILLVANSIGAYFSMIAGIGERIRRAYFISPVVDMEGLIRDRMARAGVTEEELEARAAIPTESGELSWAYFSYVREHPVRWDVPTEILYGAGDFLTSRPVMEDFARRHRARLTVMEDGEHWFHTEEEMRFLDRWIREAEERRAKGLCEG